MRKHDVIIVGCGPAGIAAAKVLKQNNIDFCIIEKKKFPRGKLCAGGLTHKSLELLRELKISLDGTDCLFVKKSRVVAENLNADLILNHEIGLVERTKFDFNNVKQLANDYLFEEETILRVEDHLLVTDKEQYEFRYLIFADGVNGYSRDLIKNRKFGFCVEYKAEGLTDTIVFDFDVVKSGYAWIFPKKDHTNIGLGIFQDHYRYDYLGALSEMAGKYGFDFDRAKAAGYQIPLFSKSIYRKSVIDEKYILVGDAASLVDRNTGEGIYYALLSGKAAAESIVTCMKNKGSLKSIYFQKTKTMCKVLSKRNMWSSILYSKLGPSLMKTVLGHERLTERLNRAFG